MLESSFRVERCRRKFRPTAHPAAVELAMALLFGLATATPAAAQWTRVDEISGTDIFNVWTKGDTIAAASDDTVFVSLDAGTTWIPSAAVPSGGKPVQLARIRNGRLFAGTSGAGMFVSDDLGATWQGYSQGLVGGIGDSQLHIVDLLVRGDSIYAATDGDGPWVRNLRIPGTWSHYGNQIELDQASNMTAIAGSPARLLATGGFNGDVFYRDPGDADWTESLLLNDRLGPGLAPLSAIWTGHSWLVASNIGVYHSATGAAPWTYTDFGLHPTFFASFALHDAIVFTSFANGAGTGIEFSTDDGGSWQVLESQPGIFTYNLATLGGTLYAGRTDGLWRRPLEGVAVAPSPPRSGRRFALAGASPVRDEAVLRFELPEHARVRIDVFDVAGRRVLVGLDEDRPPGAQDVRLNTRDLAPGIYLARLRVRGLSEVARIVRTR